jgi:uncharacterized protein YcfJ
MRKLALAPLLLALLSAAPSQAANVGFQDTAWVIASAPVYESFNEPRRECWNEQVGYERPLPRVASEIRDGNPGGAVLGGILGGILGNTLGKGDGRKVATVLGATAGAIAGDNYGGRDYRAPPEYRGEVRPVFEQRCRNVDNWSRKLTGYNVTYRYQGREYTSFMPYDPGNSVRVNVSISLAER